MAILAGQETAEREKETEARAVYEFDLGEIDTNEIIGGMLEAENTRADLVNLGHIQIRLVNVDVELAVVDV